MNEELTQMSAALESLRAEVQSLRDRLQRIERVVTIDDEEGVFIECHDLVVRPFTKPGHIAVHIGTCEERGFIDVHYPQAEHFTVSGIQIGFYGDNSPRMQVRGTDHHARVDLCILEDNGTAAVLAPGQKPGAVMRARRGGGSVAVLRPDGRPRGVLSHDEHWKNEVTGEESPATELMFATAEGDSLMKLHSTLDDSVLLIGRKDAMDQIVLLARDDGSALMLKSPQQETSVNIVANAKVACVSTHEGMIGDDKAEASLSASNKGTNLTLDACDGTRRVELSALSDAATLNLLDDTGTDRVALSHFSGSHSSLSLKGPGDHDCMSVIVNPDTTVMRLTDPVNEEAQCTAAVHDSKPTILLSRDKEALVHLGESDSGGCVTAYGTQKPGGGMVTIAGGPIAGGLCIATADGTQLLTADGSDHGGRLQVNNDLGFPRATLASYLESGSLILNHTGSNGLVASATAKGGVLTLYDADGTIIRTLPGPSDDDDDDDDSKNWGKLPGQDD